MEKNPLLKLIRFGNANMFWLLLTLVFSLGGIALTIFSSWYLGRISESAITLDLERFIDSLFPMVVVFLLQTPLSFINTYAAAKFAEQTMYHLRNTLTKKVSECPVSFLEQKSSADVLTNLNSDTGIVQQFYQDSMIQLIVQPLTFLVCTIFLFYLSFELSIVSFTAIPFFMIISLLISKPLETYAKQLQESVSDMTSITQSVVSGMAEAKSFNLQKPLGAKFEKSVDETVRKGLKMSKISALISPINTIMQSAPFLLIFSYGGFLVVSGNLSFGELIVFINLSNAVVNPLQIMPQAIGSYRAASASGARILEILEAEKEQTGNEYKPLLAEALIEFKSVTFAYEGKNDLLQDASIIIRKGDTVALVGHSGCGKSTLLKLIAGFYSPKFGEIKIAGMSIADWNIQKLRENIALVSQDVYLFPFSLYENIEYGKVGAKADEVYRAAKLAGIHEFIRALPNGYDTLVGERGVRLSGGQKQRISIARAILKDAPILLFDEATSSLDPENEHLIQQSIEMLMKNRTVVVVAHRLTSIKIASNIFVIEDGKAEVFGTHDELLEKSQTYRELFLNQVKLEM